MIKRTLKMLLHFILIIGLVFFLLLVISSLVAIFSTRGSVFNPGDVPAPRSVAIIFGAGLNRDGSPSAVLRDRVATGVELYKSGQVRKLLMSGDNRFINYNEPGAMKQYAINLGVPEGDIVLDYAGRSTYDTCYRAIHIFKVDSAFVVSQDYHLPRAIFTCRELGLSVQGVRADLRTYRRLASLMWRVREMPATLNALLEVWITHPLPVLGQVEPIFPPPVSEP